MSRSWLAVSIFCDHVCQPDLLTSQIGPLTEALKPEVDRFYFIRFGAPENHIMLRLEVEESKLEEVRTRVRETLEDHFRTNPEAFGKLTPDRRYPNGSILFPVPPQEGAYVIEPNRYGGEGGYDNAYKLFHADSIAVLASGFGNEEEAMSTALQLHFGFAQGAGMTASEAAGFYTRIQAFWRRFHAASLMKQSGDAAHTEEILERMAASFAERWALQRAGFLQYFGALGSAVDNDISNTGMPGDYVQAVRRFASTHDRLQAAGALTVTDNDPAETPDLSPERRLRQAVFKDFFHPTNNRLGLGYRAEWYLAYLMARLSEALADKSQN
ncbi:MAG: lantibiotic dehydratase C-terminal domain-containing protein [Acidobacteriota bacterium]|nr:lantibiotic dehydratase C-terminal domain-containing protein [Acidobacteriota bacterium]